MNFSKVTIIGLGLIGGSLAWALKKSKRVGEVFGIDVDEKAVDYAIQKGIIDSGSRELGDGIKHSEIMIIATYVGIIPKVAKSLITIASPGTIITDVGSVKGKVVKDIEEFLPSHLHFVGGHPVAGTERFGIKVANFDLFRGKRCILTPTSKTRPETITKVKNLWEIVGAKIFTMDPDTHDWVFGVVSHLPHVVAYALINSVASVKEPANIFDFAGGGLRDYTRIGASSPDMWGDIFLKNKENVLKAIGEFKKSLDKIQSLIEEENLKGLKEELRKSVRVRENMDKVNK
ncbi:MAG TPA: prephenate dehydrogenase [Thermodesulfobacteriota bacterium]|nr:prephenate dehydrogenase [Thermodesulfobacteriota bacterium]